MKLDSYLVFGLFSLIFAGVSANQIVVGNGYDNLDLGLNGVPYGPQLSPLGSGYNGLPLNQQLNPNGYVNGPLVGANAYGNEQILLNGVNSYGSLDALNNYGAINNGYGQVNSYAVNNQCLNGICNGYNSQYPRLLVQSINPTWLLTILVNTGKQFTELNYDFSQPPQTQWKAYPTCRGRRQSPIDISLPLQVDNGLSLSLSATANYAKPNALLFNSGGGVPLVLPTDPVSDETLTFNGIRYKFALIDIRFAQNDYEGSLHTFNGRRFPMETNSIWYREDLPSVSVALDVQGGVLSVATLYEIGQRNPAFDVIINALPQIRNANSTAVVNLDPILNSIASYLPDVRGRWYTYQGSLEVPPCSETPTWIVFDEIQQISRDQIQRIRNSGIRLPDGTVPVRNARWTQPRNNRPILVHQPTKYGPANSYSTGYTSVYGAAA